MGFILGLSILFQFSCSVMADSLQTHGLDARLPCPSPTPGAYSNMSIESVMPSSHLILCHPLLLLAPTPPSIRVFSNESTLCMRWPKYWDTQKQMKNYVVFGKKHDGISFYVVGSLSLYNQLL